MHSLYHGQPLVIWPDITSSHACGIKRAWNVAPAPPASVGSRKALYQPGARDFRGKSVPKASTNGDQLDTRLGFQSSLSPFPNAELVHWFPPPRGVRLPNACIPNARSSLVTKCRILYCQVSADLAEGYAHRRRCQSPPVKPP